MRQIVIIGGGISGLSVLHHLKKKYGPQSDVKITLFEKNTWPGGTIRTVKVGPCRFETGPNGFLTNKESTLQLARELGLEGALVTAKAESKKRFLCVNDTLHPLPMGPSDLFSFKLLSLKDKLRIPGEIFVRCGGSPRETIYDFGLRRFGKNLTENILDPMVKGIFAGDIKRLNLKETFPALYELEQNHGSLIRGMMKTPRKGKKKRTGLVSFQKGMEQLVSTLAGRHRDSIRLGKKVLAVIQDSSKYVVKTDPVEVTADELFVCAPAFAAGALLKPLSETLAYHLEKITYAPIAVVGLVYEKSALPKVPEGFGYLIPSSQNSPVLGVLFPQNIFENRGPEDHFLFRIMLGGVLHKDIVEKGEAEVLRVAEQELAKRFSIRGKPVAQRIVMWPRAIPQYDIPYLEHLEAIKEELQKFPNLNLIANYRNGISVNDCTRNAALIPAEDGVRK